MSVILSYRRLVKADRLLSFLLLLQARGKTTARDLAAELGVSVRTIYRDIEALSSAGVPIWAEGGPGGGCQLIEGYRSSLVGISAEEATALLAAAGPAPLANTGLDRDLAGARLKLLAALPAARRTEVAAEAGRFFLDAPAWFRPLPPVPHLPVLVQAVRSGRRLRLVYERPGRRSADRTIDPLGMVSKAGAWYLVAQTNNRTAVYRADRVHDVVVLDEPFLRPEGFDLAEFWHEWSTDFESSRPRLAVTVRIHPDLWDVLPEVLGEAVRLRMEAAAPPDPDGWRQIELTFESQAAARTRILGLGPEAEVLAPERIRQDVVRAAARTVALYTRQKCEH
jgi:predicted DNA-binding transcriptional regulator YafY